MFGKEFNNAKEAEIKSAQENVKKNGSAAILMIEVDCT